MEASQYQASQCPNIASDSVPLSDLMKASQCLSAVSLSDLMKKVSAVSLSDLIGAISAVSLSDLMEANSARFSAVSLSDLMKASQCPWVISWKRVSAVSLIDLMKAIKWELEILKGVMHDMFNGIESEKKA
ncbi:hypothetical protein DPMN_018274 [Dreissena polymorpha]|uniref:Uncharacterized protein n=1 Tax=Dreissena polymorpha TaxID=45954 RepID=A0A9D4NGY5_DREPO|nr:hypothetical protein DPMN_018274 [Dreissena polymorpha]